MFISQKKRKKRMSESLVSRIRNHDQQAMRQLYEMHVGRLASVCYRYVPDENDAKDVMQNSFVKIFTALPTFEYRDELSFRAWMTRIVMNEALSFLKQQRRLPMETLPDENTLMATDEEPDVERITADQLHQLVSDLPDGYRTVINLFVFEGCSHKQIAELLGIKEVTSASQLFHAKQLLAKRIKELTKQKP